MVNIHITHHAGTVFCHKMRMVGPTPEFACLGGNNWPSNETAYRPNQPWTFNDTTVMVPLMRSHFHMISWEFSKWRANLYTTNWEYPDLLSVIVMRDPIDRLLALEANARRNMATWMIPQMKRNTIGGNT